MPALLKVPPFLKQCFITISTAFVALSAGTVIGITSVIISQTKKNKQINFSDEQVSWYASVIGISTILGMFIVSFVMNYYGRKTSIILAILFEALGWICTYFGSNYNTLLFGRIVQGTGLGVVEIVSPLYISECVSPKYRALFLVVPSFFLNSGLLASHVIGITYGWETVALVGIIINGVNFILIMFSPESPSLLAMHGKYDACRRAFRWLRGKHEDKELEELIEDQKKSNVKARSIDVTRNISKRTIANLKFLGQIITKKDFYKPIILTQLLFVINEMAGGNLYNHFAIDITKKVVGDGADVPSIIYSVDIHKMVCSVLVVYVYKVFKRRVILTIFVPLNIIVTYLIATYMLARDGGIPHWQHPYMGVALIHVFMFSYSIGVNPLVNVIFGELLPLKYKHISSAIVTLTYSLTFFSHMKTAPYFFATIGYYGSYFLYGSIELICLVFVWWFLPETKDRTLLDIEGEFRNKNKTEIKLNDEKSNEIGDLIS